MICAFDPRAMTCSTIANHLLLTGSSQAEVKHHCFSTNGEGFPHFPLKTNSCSGFRCLGARSRSLSGSGRLVGSPL